LIKQVLKFGLLYYLALLVLHLAIFMVSHIPPAAVNLDGLVLVLYRVEHVLAAPRFLLRRLWPGETTPALLNLLLTVFNCLIWGCCLASLAAFWRKMR
jgi:hypothetical protein